jgi:hypothetical protein
MLKVEDGLEGTRQWQAENGSDNNPDESDHDDEQLDLAFLLDKSGNTNDDSIYIMIKGVDDPNGPRTRHGQRLYAYEVLASDTIASVKAKIQDEENTEDLPLIDLPQQRLIFAGQKLNEDYSVRHYNIKTGSLLHLIDEFDGGGTY